MPSMDELQSPLSECHLPDRGSPDRTNASRALSRGLAATISRLVCAISAEVTARRAMRQLSHMSEYGLRDLGLSLGDLERVARHGRF